MSKLPHAFHACEKAFLLAFDNSCQRRPLPELTVPFFLNPASIRVKKSARISGAPTEGHTTETRWTHTHPMEMQLGELWFDTYERKGGPITPSVYALYIRNLEKMLEYVGETHHPPCVMLLWGGFTASTGLHGIYYFWLQSMTVDYTMFLPSGTPVRAKVSLDLVQATPIEVQASENPKESPDHAKLYTVKRGDTLQAISTFAYDDPREWRRIADANGLDDPMSLRPGQRLLLPPILR